VRLRDNRQLPILQINEARQARQLEWNDEHR
jgi:hypothetical protein